MATNQKQNEETIVVSAETLAKTIEPQYCGDTLGKNKGKIFVLAKQNFVCTSLLLGKEKEASGYQVVPAEEFDGTPVGYDDIQDKSCLHGLLFTHRKAYYVVVGSKIRFVLDKAAPEDSGLLPSTSLIQESPAVATAPPPGYQLILLSAIGPNPFQPRKAFSQADMDELVLSVFEHGVLEPILVRPWPKGDVGPNGEKYQIIAGERRWRAAQVVRDQFNGSEYIGAIDKEVKDDAEAQILALVENAHRCNLTPIEEATGYARLENMKLTQEQIAVRTGKTVNQVSDRVRLLGLPVHTQELIAENKLTPSHGVSLLTLISKVPIAPEAVVNAFADKAADGRWTVSELDSEISGWKEAARQAESPELPIETPAAATETGEPGSVRTCRECGCTDMDCTQCVEKTGAPCHWVEKDLCSACVPQQQSTEPGSDAPPPATDEKTDDKPKPPSKPKAPAAPQFKVNDYVQWEAKGPMKGKWLTGKVVEVGGTLYWVLPSRIATTKGKASDRRASFHKKDCILKPWDGKSVPGPAKKPETSKVKTAAEIAAENTSTTTQITPAPEPAKPSAPPGFTATFVPEAECFRLNDAGVSVPQLFQNGCRLLNLCDELGIGLDDLVTSTEAYFRGETVAPAEPSSGEWWKAYVVREMAARWKDLGETDPGDQEVRFVNDIDGVYSFVFDADAELVARECDLPLERLNGLRYCIVSQDYRSEKAALLIAKGFTPVFNGESDPFGEGEESSPASVSPRAMLEAAAAPIAETMLELRDGLVTTQAERWEKLKETHADELVFLAVGNLTVTFEDDAKAIPSGFLWELKEAGDRVFCIPPQMSATSLVELLRAKGYRVKVFDENNNEIANG